MHAQCVALCGTKDDYILIAMGGVEGDQICPKIFVRHKLMPPLFYLNHTYQFTLLKSEGRK